MNMRHGRDGPGTNGPGTKGRGRGTPCKITSTPDQTPTEAASVFSYGSRRRAFGQATVSDAVDGDSAVAQVLAWDSGWQSELGFQVRTTIVAGPDGGLRRRWAEGILFGPDQAADEDRFDAGDGEDPGLSGVREPRRGPGGSGSDAVRLFLAHDPDVLSLTAS